MVLLGLGSNVGDRMKYLDAAVRRLAVILTNTRLSRVFESRALLPENATPDMNLPYLNMVLAADTTHTPQALLADIKALEQALGRVQRQVWGPREIDIDILAMDDLVLDTPELSIPHPHMLARDFVLLPMADVAADWLYPVAGEHYGKPLNDLVQLYGYGTSEHLRDTGVRLHV